MQQRPLSLSLNPQLDFDLFQPGSNIEIVAHLSAAAIGCGESFIYLHGAPGTGKSHLLQACCAAARNAGQSISYLPLRDLADYGSECLEGLADRDLVCLDDIDAIAGDPDWEAGLFNCFNCLLETRSRLIVAAAEPPTALPFRLVDLATRLSWGLTLRLQPLDEAETLDALASHARELGFELTPEVGRYLIRRCRRDLRGLRELLVNLDHATLAAKRKLTVRFLKDYLDQGS